MTKLSIKLISRRPETNLTGSAALAHAAHLISGTVLPVVGLGYGLTIQPSYTSVGFSLRSPAAPAGPIAGLRPTLSRKTKRRKSRKPEVDLLSSIQRAALSSPREIVVPERISCMESHIAAPVRLIGAPRSAPRPTTKSYDLDLDEFQV